MPGRSTTLVIRILADARQAASTMNKAAGSTNKFASGLNKASLPALAVVGAFGAMGKAAAEDAQGQALLANSLKKSAGASKTQIASVEDWISATTLATGVADDQLRPALASLGRATGDVTESQKAMATVMDVAAATGKDTQSVADAVAKAYAGNTTSLGRMVPGIDKAILKSGDMNQIMGELARVTGGSAATAAETAAGKFKRTQVAMSETKESIGAALLPMLEKVTGVLVTFGTWAANNTKTVTAFAIALGILATAVLAVNAAYKVITAATRIWAAVQWALNSALLANPITWIVIGIIALIAVLIIAYKKSATFRAAVAAAWSGIKTAIVAVWNILKKTVFLPYILYFKLLMAVVRLASAGIKKAWAAIKTALGSVWNWLKTNVFNPLVAVFKAIWQAAQDMARIVGDAWSGLKAALKAVYDWIKSNVIDPLVNAFDTVVDAVKDVIDWIKNIKIPAPVKAIIDKVGGIFRAAPTPPPPAPPAPQVARGRRGHAPAGTDVGLPATGPRDALGSLGVEPQVIVQVSDRKMAHLVDVSVRASATSAARNLTRRRVVTV